MSTIVVLLCGAIGVALGEIHLFAAGAPRRYLVVNAAALTVGVVIVALARSLRHRAPADAVRTSASPLAAGMATVAVGLCLLGTALLTDPVDGASRWIRVGGLSLQPSLILLPATLIAFAGRRDPIAAIGLSIAAVALALQPDRAMAGTLAAGLLALWIAGRRQGERHGRGEGPVTFALLIALVSFAATCLRPDTVPPVRYVEQVVSSAFAWHPLTGLTVIAGLPVMLAPATLGDGRRSADRDVTLVFGATWLAIIVAALLGNYPTPLVGAGSSAILGYCLCALTAERSDTRP